MQVVATQLGYYGGKRREPGEEFGLIDRAGFAAIWMEPKGWHPDDEEEVLVKPAPKPEPKPLPKSVQVSTETKVTPPLNPAKRVDPISGDDI